MNYDISDCCYWTRKLETGGGLYTYVRVRDLNAKSEHTTTVVKLKYVSVSRFGGVDVMTS